MVFALAGAVVRVNALRFGGESGGSSGLGGNSEETTLKRSPFISIDHPARPKRCRLKLLDRSAIHLGRSKAIVFPRLGWDLGEILQGADHFARVLANPGALAN